MAFPKNISRTIVVENIKYNWVASGNDNIINLIISLEENSGQKLLMSFEYLQTDNQKLFETKITPKTVEKAIKYGIRQGWKPELKQKDLNLYTVEFSEL